MRLKKHIKLLLELLEDIRKEPHPSVLGFAYSAALVHMFHITFFDELDPGRTVKHTDFGSKDRANKLKLIIKNFPEKNDLFTTWKLMENKRNELCYGSASKEDINKYVETFYQIKLILEKVSGKKFDIEYLRKWLKEVQNE